MFRGIRKIAAEFAAYPGYHLVFAVLSGAVAWLLSSSTLIAVTVAVLVPIVIAACVVYTFKLWTVTKFVILFAAIAGFVSYNFGGLAIGLSVAAAVTALAVAQWKIFDAATDALLDVHKEDGGVEKVKKTAIVGLIRFLYSLQDYGLAAVSVALVIAAREYGYSYAAAIVAMWLLIDLPVTVAYVAVYETTGRDLTLGRAYRRMVNAIFAQSRIAGMIAMMYEVTLASFWSGPDYTVLFFRDELRTRKRMAVAVVAITAIHAVLWTTVYWLGYENILELIQYIRK